MRWAQQRGSDGNTYYAWFDDKEDENGDSPYKYALSRGWSPVDFDESKAYTFVPDGQSDTQVTLNPDGTHDITVTPQNNTSSSGALAAGGAVILLQPEGPGEVVAAGIITTAVAAYLLSQPYTIHNPTPKVDPFFFARKKDLDLIDYIADKYDIPRDLLSEGIHERKRMVGRGGADNLGKAAIEEIAREVKESLRPKDDTADEPNDEP
jgi:hypothetical protein